MSPHQAREFANAAEYTIRLTFVVAGGARWRTAQARARRIAERLTNTAARAKGVVDVSAVAGPSRDGELLSPERVCFEAANTGQVTGVERTKLDRYLDVDHERALASLEQARAVARDRRQADLDRRQRIGCANPAGLAVGLARPCSCAYCRPRHHLEARTAMAGPWVEVPCLCGGPAAPPAAGCRPHRDQQLVVLDGDPSELTRLAAAVAPQRPLDRPPSLGRDEPDPPPPGMPPPGC